jgi:drug/metabolite transporter (DMT)-like permease
MNTRFIVGAIILAVSVVSIAVIYLVARNPMKSKCTDETTTGNVILSLAVGGLVIGPTLLGEGLFGNLDLLSAMDMIIAFGILGLGILTIFLLRIKKRVTGYEVLRNDPALTNK